jgi:peroxiredoxin
MTCFMRKQESTGKTSRVPAEFLVDSSGVVRWVNLTEDFRVRARPEQIIAAAKTLK